ncbi:MAG: hypothetical protein ACI80L_000808 [Pseudohongiellaceae bacterium]|jgi:hypothetical protein
MTSKRYIFQLMAGIALYGVGLVAMNAMYSVEQSGYWLILLPVIPILFVTATIIQFIVTRDEMQQKIITQSLAFSALATGFTCFSYLFLRDLGAAEFHAEWAFYLMWFYYGLAFCWYWRKYG